MPTCNHGAWADVSEQFPHWVSNFDQDKDLVTTPEQRRWTPQDYLEGNFFEGIRSMMGAGCPSMKDGLSISYYSCTKSMTDKKIAMYSADGDILIVPQFGTLHITTEFGKLTVASKEIAVVPRGVKFSVDL